MRLLDFIKKDKEETTEVALKHDEEDESKHKIGVGIALDTSVKNSTAQANIKYRKIGRAHV